MGMPVKLSDDLVKEARGRRLFPASPRNSLLLLKGTATLPHGGGKRFDADSDDYKLLVRWVAQGMPYGLTNDPTVERIEVWSPARWAEVQRKARRPEAKADLARRLSELL